MERIALFIDVQNIYYTVKDGLKGQFDYNSFWARVVHSNCEVVMANAYAIDRNDKKQKQFQNILKGIGFNVKLRPFISRNDGTAKGDWDVGITLDMIELAYKVDRFILLSGDGDFDLLVDNLRSKNKKVDIYGVSQLTADSLKNAATVFHPIDHSYLMNR